MDSVTFFFDWEVRLMEWIQTNLPFLCNKLSQLFSAFGEQVVLVAILGFLYWCYDKELGKFVGVNVLTSLMWNPLIKNILIRNRPYMDHETIKCLRPVDKSADIYNISAQGYSFPSAHSSNAASVYVSIAVYCKKRILTVIAVVLPLLVGISRVAVGVHYPTDVLGGWALGLITLAVMVFLQKKIKNPAILYLLIVLTGIPCWFYCRSTDFYSSFGLIVGAFAGFLFEAKYVHFENTRSVVRSILRVLCGGAIFAVLDILLKLPFDRAFSDSVTIAAFAVRSARYAIASFTVMGIYPVLFKYTAKIGGKKE